MGKQKTIFEEQLTERELYIRRHISVIVSDKMSAIVLSSPRNRGNKTLLRSFIVYGWQRDRIADEVYISVASSETYIKH